jgi:hypothetical protein
MSFPHKSPKELEQLLEEYSFKLEDYKRKFNPFLKEVSHNLKKKVDELRSKVERYAHYHREHQLKHLLESHRVRSEMSLIHSEVEELRIKMKELEKEWEGENLS